MRAFAPGRFRRVGVCFASACCGLAYAYWYTQVESHAFREFYFLSFLLRTVHAFLVGTFEVAVLLYFLGGNGDFMRMVKEQRLLITAFAVFSLFHMLLPLFGHPAVLLTKGTAIFIFSTIVTVLSTNSSMSDRGDANFTQPADAQR